MTSDVAVVILAGGEGRRVGGEKPLRILRGERLIDRALRGAHRWSDLVAVSVREAAQVEPIGTRLLIDEADVAGPLGGLISALRFAEASDRKFVLTLPADMPLLPDDLLDRLAVSIGNFGCAFASSGGHAHPVCALWSTTTLGKIEDYLESGSRSLKGLAELVGCVIVEWPAEPIDPFFNINTIDDLLLAGTLL
jgi:molybdenum cofactor guanylyltransferase